MYFKEAYLELQEINALVKIYTYHGYFRAQHDKPHFFKNSRNPVLNTGFSGNQ